MPPSIPVSGKTKLTEAIEAVGYSLSEGQSDGEVTCTGCWDESGHDVKADTCIPAGQPIWVRRTSYETDEGDPYCESCAGRAALNEGGEGNEG